MMKAVQDSSERHSRVIGKHRYRPDQVEVAALDRWSRGTCDVVSSRMLGDITNAIISTNIVHPR